MAENKKASEGLNVPEAKAGATCNVSGEEMVHIRLFKDNARYKDDVFVAVNGRSWQIKRGEDVEIPAYVAAVLEQSLKQDANTARLIERTSSGPNE